jgi:hypothetical protein
VPLERLYLALAGAAKKISDKSAMYAGESKSSFAE